MPMWAITKNYSVSGGQSMAAVKLGVTRYGDYAVTDPGIGEYPGTVSRDLYEKAAPYAQKRQLCNCRIGPTGTSRNRRTRQVTMTVVEGKWNQFLVSWGLPNPLRLT